MNIDNGKQIMGSGFLSNLFGRHFVYSKTISFLYLHTYVLS